MTCELTIIVPCYNEEKNLNKLLYNIQELLNLNSFIKVFLVDNGSTDNSNKMIKNNPIFKLQNFELIEVKKNIGYGNGIMQGLKKVDTKFYSWTHADLQTDIKDVLNAYNINKDKLDKENCIIKGKRKNRNFLDNLFTVCMSFIATILTLSLQYDINAQPKIFSKKMFLKLKNPPDDFMLDLYFMIMVKKFRFKIINHPVYFKKRKFGVAKGGGSIKGKIILSLLTIKYLLFGRY